MLRDENCKLKGCLRRGWFIEDRKIRFPWWRKATSRGFFALSFVSLVCRGKIAFCRDENRDSEIVEFVEEPVGLCSVLISRMLRERGQRWRKIGT